MINLVEYVEIVKIQKEYHNSYIPAISGVRRIFSRGGGGGFKIESKISQRLRKIRKSRRPKSRSVGGGVRGHIFFFLVSKFENLTFCSVGGGLRLAFFRSTMGIFFFFFFFLIIKKKKKKRGGGF